MAITLDGTNGINSSGVIVAPDGSASAPSITNDGDTNTGIFFPAADTIAFAEGGAEAMRIDSSGNVGIGTSSPVAYGTRRTLAIDGTGGVVVDLFVAGTRTGTIVAETNDLQIGTIANGPTRFLTNGSERARITSGGYFKASDSGTYADSSASYHEFNTNGTTWNTIISSRNATAGNNYGVIIQYINGSPNGTGNQFLYCADQVAVRAMIRSNGGIANYSANNVNLSDRREKTNFAPAKNYLDTICAIPVQTFNYIDQNLEEDDGLTLGVVAQDVQEVAPELVMESNWGTEEEPKMRLSIYQTDLQYALMKSIQELKAELDQAKERIAALEEQRNV